MFQISIIRADGVSEKSEYQFFLDSKSLKISKEYSGISVEILSHGVLRIFLKDPGNQMPLYTVGLHTSILPLEGFQWIPLLETQELLEDFPEDVPNPKLLVMVSNEVIPAQSICQNCELLKSEHLKYQQDISKTLKDYKISSDNFTAENEKNKVLLKKFQNLYTDCKKDLDAYKLKFEEEKKKNSELAENIKTLGIKIDENSLKAKMREEFLENIINDREKEYSKLNMERLRTESLSKNENERINISTPGTGKSTPNLNNLSQTSFIKDNQSQSKFKNTRKVLSEINNCSLDTTETHTALKEYLKKTNRLGLFKKDQGNMFKFGKKKVLIALKHGNLLCRVGGGFEHIEDFISKNQEQKPSISPLDKSHRRYKTIDDLNKTEFDLANSIYCRSSPEIEKLIKLRIRPSSNCNTE
jgi:Growth-Arrest-Specific Protein 2 Domain